VAKHGSFRHRCGQTAKIVVDEKEMLPPDGRRIFIAISKAMNAFRRDYTKVKAPALAFYATPEHPPGAPPKTDEATRRQWDDGGGRTSFFAAEASSNSAAKRRAGKSSR